ncbi:hypothetical protein B0H13DRAFT_1876252 [Mycena leptocephala]|nr:hypothetical protein B0H13DRAFT_1876252 [Mycena leptocephala]
MASMIPRDDNPLRYYLNERDTRLYTLTVEMLLGVHRYVWILPECPAHPWNIGNRFIAISTIVLFVLCTMHCVVLLVGTIFGNADLTAHVLADYQSYAYHNLLYTIFYRAANAVYVTSNRQHFRQLVWQNWFPYSAATQSGTFAAESLSFQRFLLWLLRMYSADSNDGLTFPAFLFDISVVMAVITTFILMGLSAGRIWWLAHKAQGVMGRKVTSKYYTVCAMILESGALYCAGGILFAVAVFYPWTISSLDNFDVTPTGAILGQLVGIAPTIIAVRVGLGKSVDSVDSFSLTATRPPARHPLEFQPTASATNCMKTGFYTFGPKVSKTVRPKLSLESILSKESVDVGWGSSNGALRSTWRKRH